MPEKKINADSQKVVIAAIIGGILVTAIKFAAAFITGSSAMLSEAIHSVVDTVNDALLMVGIHRSRRPPDDAHPFGYGKELYFYSLIVALVILAFGGGMSILEGTRHILHPEPITNIMWNYAALGGAAIFEGASLAVALREFRKIMGSGSVLNAIHASKDPSNFSVMLEDVSALLGILVAFLGILFSHTFHIKSADGIASIVIGLILSAVAVILAYETHGLLIGEGASKHMLDAIQQIVTADHDVIGMRRPSTMYFGPHTVLLNMEVEFADRLAANDVESAIDRLECKIRARFPDVTRIFIESESIVRRNQAGQPINVP